MFKFFNATNARLAFGFVFLLSGTIWRLAAQSASFGNVYIDSGGEASIFSSNHTFQSGIVGTDRSIASKGLLSFVGASTVTNASDAAHVDGYVRTYQTGAFVFPIGDNGKYRPAAVSTAALNGPATAAYYGVNPSVAITTSFKGGNEPLLPGGAPFASTSFGSTLKAVSTAEYWDIDGTTAAKITLSWNASSAVATLTSNRINDLTIAGWDGQKWVLIPSTVDATSIFGTSSGIATTGSITTTNSIAPNTYTVYTLAAANTAVTVNIKVLLQGAMLGSTDGLMRDALRAGNYIPTVDPYTNAGFARFTHAGLGAQASISNTAILNTTGNNAIVDWVFVELRSASAPATVVETRAALLQRDGDVVSPSDGTSPIAFEALAGSQYYVSIKHRNHLGAMTANPISITNGAITVDFTTLTDAQVYNIPGAVDYNGYEMATIGSVKALWAGNANADNRIQYQGSVIDISTVLNEVVTFSGNSTGLYNYDSALGYWRGDINMDAKVKYQGLNNDILLILTNVISYGLNTTQLYNYANFYEQIP